MRRTTFWTLVLLAFSVGSVSVANGQEGRPTGERPDARVRVTQAVEPALPATSSVSAQGNPAAVPRLVKFTGVLTELPRSPLSGPVEMTLGLYKDEVGGEALWTETQSVEVDKEGRYTVLLGATQLEGLPAELFTSGEVRWLDVDIQGQPRRPRTLLVSVPYALKAGDAEKLAGKSASDFVLSESLGEQVRQVIQAQGQAAGQSTLAGAQQKQAGTSSTTTPQTTAAGPMFPPSTFSGANSTQIVRVQQNGTGAGLVATASQDNALSGRSTASSGVYGQTDGTFGAGVFGNATPTNGQAAGVYGQTVNWVGVGGQALATSGSPAYGVWGDSLSTDGVGVAGYEDATSGFTNGVYGQNTSANGAGVFGNAVATSGNADGVVGQTANAGNGVAGFATAASGYASGVFGQTASPGGHGVVGTNNATTGFNSGVFGFSASANGTGVAGQTVQWVGVGGLATATSGTPAYGVYGDTASTSGAGIIGFADATSGYSYGAAGNNASINGIGVFGNATATSGFPSGVYGVTISPNGNGAVGYAGSTSGFPNAVVGFLNSNDGGVAGQFFTHGGKGLILQGLSGPNFNQVFSVDANGDLTISGNLTVSGTKSSTAKLQNGREVALYAVESPENWFEDFGSGELKNGSAWVPLDGSFAEATNTAITYHVFLTPNGDSNGLYVARKTASGFEVKEHAGGGSNVAFDYRIVVRRRGYETIRMAEVHGDVNTLEASRQQLTQMANASGSRKPTVVKAPQTVQAPLIRPVPPRPSVPNPPKPNIPQPPQARK